MNLSEEYYDNLFEDLLKTLNEDNDELLNDIFRNIVFREITNSDNLLTNKKLFLYKENVLNFFQEGITLKKILQYGNKDIKDVGKDIKKISKIKIPINKTTASKIVGGSNAEKLKSIGKNISKLGGKARETVKKASEIKIKPITGAKILGGSKAQQTIDIVAKRTEELDKSITNLQQRMDRVSKNFKDAMKTKKAKVAGGIAVAVFVAWIVKKFYNVIRTSMYGECGKLKGKEYIICRAKFLKEYRKVVNEQKLNCNKTNDPDKCVQKLEQVADRIDKERAKVLSKIS